MILLEDKFLVIKKHFAVILVLFCCTKIFAQKDSIKIPPVKSNSEVSNISSSIAPQFPGGHTAFVRAIVNNFRTSELTKQNIPLVRAVAVFDIDSEGNMINLKIESADNETVKKEFLSALNKVKTKWIPGEQDGVKVKMRMRQPLNFNLE